MTDATAGSASDADSETSKLWNDPTLFSLYEQDIFSDCTIVCGGHTFKGHIRVLAGACKYFEKAFCGAFEEASSRKLDFSNDEWRIVSAMIKFAYGCAYDNAWPDEGFMKDDADAYILADRLEDGLFKAAASKSLMNVSHYTGYNFDQIRGWLSYLDTNAVGGDITFERASELCIWTNFKEIKSADPQRVIKLASENKILARCLLHASVATRWSCKHCDIDFSLHFHRGQCLPIRCPKCTRMTVKPENMPRTLLVDRPGSECNDSDSDSDRNSTSADDGNE